MANTISLAVKYINDVKNFNQVYKNEAKTTDLETNELKVLDGNAVKMPNYGFSTAVMGTYSRDTGAPSANLVETWKTYTLSQDKGNSLVLDVMDDEETLGEGLIKRANEFTRRVIVPGIDAYRFGVLASVPTPAATPTVVGAKIVNGTLSTSSTAIENLDNAFKYLEDNEVPMEGLILYCTPSFRLAMQRSTEIAKRFEVQTKQTDVNTTIELYNGAKIVTVPSSRLGAVVEFILVQPRSVASCVKFNESRLVDLTETSTSNFGQAWKYRVYYDLFISEGSTIIEGADATKVLINPGIYVKKADYWTVTFDEHDGSVVAPILVPKGQAIPLAPTSTKEGKVLSGWFAAASGGTAIVFPYTPSADVTLHAQWADA